ncbi:MAG TPA: glycosyltransferase N-terminal domain-containing protein [Candidatus Latescibacteria bacterium]|nr:glycosyltransferase N-terminal domain-containing protein [Candidatus Latescibacterota bacterium]
MSTRAFCYDLLWKSGLSAGSPLLLLAWATGRYEVRDRLFPKPFDLPFPFWMWHGASAGEVRGLRPLWEHFGGVASADVHLSCTRSGVAMWSQFGIECTHIRLFPADSAASWASMCRKQYPALVIVSETELWPGLFHAMVQRRVPVLLVSARVSQRTTTLMKASRLLADIAPALFVCAQTGDDAARFSSLGVPCEQTAVCGSLKWCRGSLANRADARAAMQMDGDDRVVVFGSVHREEMSHVVSAIEQIRLAGVSSRFVVAPRHMTDYDYADTILKRGGLRPLRLSSLAHTGILTPESVLLVDKMGVLAQLYAGADVAVIGGAWVPLGGHNPFEATAYGLPVVYGPHMEQAGCNLLEASGQATRAHDGRMAGAIIADILRNYPGPFQSAIPDALAATVEAMARWRLPSRSKAHD